jgi:tRNA pseudouridine38-40 synthase
LNYCFQISYNGANYNGWQKQKNAHTIQAEIENALQKITQEEIKILGCGRTDTGVHAREFYFNSKMQSHLTKNIIHKLNTLCPKDIVFKNVWQVNETFSARFDALSRTYTYHISSHKNPFMGHLQIWYKLHLDIHKMNQACTYLIGKHDFECFSKVKTEVNNFFCEVKQAQFVQENNQLTFTIEANRFLRNMVRAIVGTLMDIGTGKYEPSHMKDVMNSKSRNKAGTSVPAQALFLDKIEYDKKTWLSL